jgi:hypothetical protein
MSIFQIKKMEKEDTQKDITYWTAQQSFRILALKYYSVVKEFSKWLVMI